MNKRNKIFSNWLYQVADSFDRNDREEHVTMRYKLKTKLNVLDVLRYHALKRKRERLVSEIIWEKRHQVLAMGALDWWRAKLFAKLKRKHLKIQVMINYNAKLMT